MALYDTFLINKQFLELIRAVTWLAQLDCVGVSIHWLSTVKWIKSNCLEAYIYIYIYIKTSNNTDRISTSDLLSQKLHMLCWCHMWVWIVADDSFITFTCSWEYAPLNCWSLHGLDCTWYQHTFGLLSTKKKKLLVVMTSWMRLRRFFLKVTVWILKCLLLDPQLWKGMWSAWKLW